MSVPFRLAQPTFPEEIEREHPSEWWHTWQALGAGAAIVGTLIAALVYFRPMMAPHQTCDDLTRSMDQIALFLQRGDSATAIALAEQALSPDTTPADKLAACPVPKTAIATRWYAASMDGLFSLPRQVDLLRPESPIRWRKIEDKANAFGVPKVERIPDFQVAQRAYGVGMWPLADAALLQAWQQHTAGLDAVALRYATLRNWGHDLAFGNPPPALERGVRLLATARDLAHRFHLDDGAVCVEDLPRLGYLDCSAPAAGPPDAMLMAPMD